jgi:hypothetical protein
MLLFENEKERERLHKSMIRMLENNHNTVATQNL